MDRKRIPADWRKKVGVIRVKILKEFSSLPKEIDPYFQTLDPEGESSIFLSYQFGEFDLICFFFVLFFGLHLSFNT